MSKRRTKYTEVLDQLPMTVAEYNRLHSQIRYWLNRRGLVDVGRYYVHARGKRPNEEPRPDMPPWVFWEVFYEEWQKAANNNGFDYHNWMGMKQHIQSLETKALGKPGQGGQATAPS